MEKFNYATAFQVDSSVTLQYQHNNPKDVCQVKFFGCKVLNGNTFLRHFFHDSSICVFISFQFFLLQCLTAIDEASNMTWSKNENDVTTTLFGEPSTIKIISIISSYHGRKKIVSSSSSICKTMIKNSNANWYHFWHWLYYSQKNPIFCTYNLQSLHGHSSGFHFYIFRFKETDPYFCLLYMTKKWKQFCRACFIKYSSSLCGWQKTHKSVRLEQKLES